jgi:sec-independent protein translocase protein TatA
LVPLQSSISPIGFIMIIAVALLLFGPSKLPELGKAFGKTLREFKNGAKELMSDEDEKPQVQPRKEIHADEVEVHEAQVIREPKDNRRLPD